MCTWQLVPLIYIIMAAGLQICIIIDQYVHSNSVSLGTGTQCTDRDVH